MSVENGTIPKIIKDKVIKAVAITMLLATAAAAVSLYFVSKHRHEHAELHARRQGSILSYSVRSTLLNLDTLAALVVNGNGQVENFYEISKNLREKSASKDAIGSLQLAPKGVVTQIYPEQGNEKGKIDLFADPERRTEAEWARDTGNTTLAGPYKLLQGGFASVARMPVYMNNAEGKKEFWGFVVLILNMPQALEPARLDDLSEEGYEYCLWRKDPKTGKKFVISRNMEHELVNPVSTQINMPNVTWFFDVVPQNGWINLRDYLHALGFILLCCLMSGAYTYHVELERMRDARRTYANMVRNVLDNIASGVAVCRLVDGGLRPLIANERFMNYLNVTEAQFESMDVQKFLLESGWQMPPGLLYNASAFNHYHCTYESQQAQRHTGEKHWFVFSIECMLTKNGSQLLYLTTTNIDKQKQAERSAMMDSLTHLLNKGALEQKISERIAEGGTLFMLDLDNFKGVNDSFGHQAGDQLLCELAKELRIAFNAESLIGRIGGDEFVVYVPQLLDEEAIAQLMHNLRTALHDDGINGDVAKLEQVKLGASIGVVVAQAGEYNSFEEVFATLDGKMYEAKSKGKDNYVI